MCKICQTSKFPEGREYGDASMPNWPHGHRTPYSGSPHQFCVGARGNVLGQATFLPPFLHFLFDGENTFPLGSMTVALWAAI